MSARPFLLISVMSLIYGITARADRPALDMNKLSSKAKECLAYARKHHSNTHYCILMDMSLPSGIKRFAVWDFYKNDTLLTGLVSHGCGPGPWSWTWSKDKPVFSNAMNSHSTSLGKYMITARAYSQWGVHVKYLLAGLESSNSHAARRQVVLHSWNQVPEKEPYPNGTPEGWGCPAISNQSMLFTDPILRSQKSAVLLWIFN